MLAQRRLSRATEALARALAIGLLVQDSSWTINWSLSRPTLLGPTDSMAATLSLSTARVQAYTAV